MAEIKKEEVNIDEAKTKFELPFSPLTFAVMMLALGFLGGMIGSQFKGISERIVQLGTKNITVQEQSATIDVVKKVSPSVVSITSVQSTRDFFGQLRNSQAFGTGFIVSEDGLIITNKHVVSGGGSFSVFTSDGKEHKATVKAEDPIYDIAFLKIDARGLTPVELGDSDKLAVGQKVIAIGNALGQYQNTVTTGVVSAVGRAIEAGDSSGASETLENMIQTDAAINPGNSGGPLINIDGQVIGINTAVDGQGEGIGFAIPINLAKSDFKSVTEKGKIVRPMLGIRYINITKEFAARNNLPVQSGALLYASRGEIAVVPGYPAAKAGLREGDIITKINDETIGEGKSLINLISKHSVGDRVKVTYLRDNKESSVDLTLTEAN